MKINNHIVFSAVEDRIAEGQQVDIPLNGTSMMSMLHNGDILTLSPLVAEPQVGDIVLFRYEDRHLLHRIISIEGDRFVTQGDNCVVTESARRSDIVAILTAFRHDGQTIEAGSDMWLKCSRRSLVRKKQKHFIVKWLGREGRKKLRPWYFAALAFLMWAPLNGVGIPLDNFILGLRADHLLHASVYIPCALFVFDLFPKRRWLGWLLACGIGLFTESVQYLLPFRKFDINDMLANVIGITIGWLVLRWLWKRRGKLFFRK